MTARQELSGRLGRYLIVRKLGAGGMGSVYLAEDTHLGRQVALKVPHVADENGNAVERFRREASVAARIEHPNLCPVFDVDEIDGILFFTMPFIEGTPLSRLIEEGKPWPASRAIELVRRLAQGVSHLHVRGIVHRDLKPANVMVRASGEPVLMDFGLARVFTAPAQLLTAAGQPMGSPSYMAPEQVLGRRDIGPGTDVYGLGMILYELLTATRPFEGPMAVVFAQVLNAMPPPPSTFAPGLDTRLDALCLKALSKVPQERPPTAEAFAAELAALSEQLLIPVPTMTSAAPPPPSAVATQVGGPPPSVPLLPAEMAGQPRMECPRCGKASRIPSTLVGRRVKCPHCGAGLGRLRTRLQGRGRPRRMENSIGMKLVLIPGGSFLRGSPADEGGDDERPQRRITITRPFYMGVVQVTQQEYRQVMGNNPSSFRVAGTGEERVQGLDTSRLPVESVSWHDAVRFCEKLSALEPERAAGCVYRLPTEAEWELACRGGSAVITSFHFGSSLSSRQANFNGNFPFGPGAKQGVALRRPTTVGSYPKNGFGLFDMHGNVWEWCADWYDSGYYAISLETDPPGPEDGVYRVARGGSWFNDGGDCRSASRNAREPDQRDDLVGFRVVCVVS